MLSLDVKLQVSVSTLTSMEAAWSENLITLYIAKRRCVQVELSHSVHWLTTA